MRILHLWRSPSMSGGGGGMSMGRINGNLRARGIDSRIMCDSADHGMAVEASMPRWRYIDGALRRVTSRAGLNDVHRLSSFVVPRHKEVRAADVVHIHGTHTGFFNYLAFPALTKHNAVVFTLRDMWPLTGHCAANYDCERWRVGCGQCPYLEAHPAVRRDATGLEWRLKRFVYARSDFAVVAISHYMARCAQEGLLQNFPIRVIPNGLDTTAYYPGDQQEARRALGLADSKFVVLCVGTDLAQSHKGGDLLLAALSGLSSEERDDVTLLLVGRGGQRFAQESPVQSRMTGYVTDSGSLRRAYVAADVTIIPSRSEAFSNVALESLACGTPVASFAVGGLEETVRHGQTGLLAPAESADGLTNNIRTLLDQPELRKSMSTLARAMVEREFSKEEEARRYIELYRDLIEVRSGRGSSSDMHDA